MVCLGNICRSPIAEGVMRQKIKENGLNWTVDSAGTLSYHVGEMPHRSSMRICALHGIDISGQRARQLSPADFQEFDKIYAMASDVYEGISRVAPTGNAMERVDYFLNELHPGSDATVPDPYYGPEEGFTEVYQLVEETCEAIIKKYK
ncbi:MAG: low molecular weight phosphotyrosine protein phosphatase [Chitinophagia bacterium]|nr:low molecular weight phosphotyrosine protein phosphatase [Chitinophagia bacterium]